MATNLILAADRLPENVEKGADGGPRFQTLIQPQHSGREVRIPVWSQTRGEWNIAYGIRDKSDLEEVIALFYAAQGRAAAFLFKDWSDFEIGDPNDAANDNLQIGTGNGSNPVFQIVKRYILPSAAFHDRTIKRILAGTLSVFVDGVLQVNPTHYSVNLSTGVITFVTPPGNGLSVSVACEFNVLVRFDDDHLAISMETFESGEIPPILILEVKE